MQLVSNRAGSVPSRFGSERSQAAMVPFRDALLGSTLETRNTSSRRRAMASAIALLGIAIHFGRVDMAHAGIEAGLQRPDRRSAVTWVDIPGALPDD